MYRHFSLIGLFFILGVSSTWAQRVRPFYQSSRALAMGDAFTAYGEGYDAVYYNPAGVAKKNPISVKIFDLEFAISQEQFSYLKDSITNITNLTEMVNHLVANPGKAQSIGLSFAPQFMVKNFSFGVLGKTFVEGFADTSGTLQMYSVADLAAFAHFGVGLWGGIVKLGAGVKILDRAELNRTYTAADYAGGLNFSTEWQEGFGYGFDLGMLITYPSSLLPTIGISWQDVGMTKLQEKHFIFTGSAATSGAPPSLPQKLNAGLSISPKYAKDVKSVLAIELKDILGSNPSSSYLDRFHAGWELNIKKFLVLRAGVNQGIYWTGGFGLNLMGTLLEFTTYGENISHTPGVKFGDRKYILRYAITF